MVPSRVPPPRNITEIGGYLNLLGTLGQTDMRTQVLAGILGVAGPNPALGWSMATTLTLVPLPNDRPAGPAQASLPVTVPVRSDFIGPLKAALQTFHDVGGMFPFAGAPQALPVAGNNAQPPADPLPYIGRVLWVAASTTVVDPATGPVVLARPAGSSDPYRIMVRVSGPGTGAIAAANYDALQCTATTCTTVALAGALLVDVSAALADAGFYASDPLPVPTSLGDTKWSRLTNVTGLVTGVTTLGDELALVHPWTTVASSVFAGIVGWVWNGIAFVPPGTTA